METSNIMDSKFKIGDRVFWVCDCGKPHIRNAKITEIKDGFCTLDIILPPISPEEMDFRPNYKPGPISKIQSILFKTPEAAFDSFKESEIKKAFEFYNESVSQAVRKAEKRILTARTLTMLPIDKYNESI